MTITLNGTTGITTPDITSAAGLDAADLTGTVASARLPAGSVIQVVQGTFNTSSSSASTSYVDTGLNASITPTSSSSKILVLISQAIFAAGASQGQAAYLSLVRGSTQIWETLNSAVQTYDQGGSGVEVGSYVAIHYLDSPATTSSTTYKTQIKRDGSGGSESRWRSGTIILMEIAA